MQTTHYPGIDVTLATNMTFDRKLYALEFKNAVQHFSEIENGGIINKTAVPSESENRPVDHYNHRMVQERVKDKSLTHSLGMWETVKQFADDNMTKYSHVVFNGIGGSYLGPYMLVEALLGDDYNAVQIKQHRPELHFVANTDPRSFSQLAENIDIAKTLFVNISKSGSTAETATNTNTFLELLQKANLPPSEHCVAITVNGSELSKNSRQWKAQFFMEEATGGRTSVCSAVAAVPCAFANIDFGSFLKGMSDMDEQTRHEDNNIALEIAALIDTLINTFGEKNMIILGYSDSLKQYAHYCQELYMESLGKQYCADGRIEPHGLTVLGGIGTGEQHAFMEEVEKGISDAFVKFIHYKSVGTNDYDDKKAGTMGRQLLAFLKGTELALRQNGRSFMTITVAECSAYCLGQLIAMEERIVSSLAFFWAINAYDEPGVQDGKLAAGKVNKLSLTLEEKLTTCSGTAREILASLGVEEDPWLVESILSDMCFNKSVSYKSLKVSGHREWKNGEFRFVFE